ncbi:unnamed protein product [Lactuca virosa]|uniref:Uncharacterized protein n=1 Tax=Lactuca virosa TaxID=75947 RepID=A0AAU9LD42_9ASTR|nr:unnamed protein product [Lactuca virosa]
MDQPQRKKSVTLIRGNPKNKVDLEIEFDELGQNIGATQSQFRNYCGVMVRTRISILILRWDEVPKAEIYELWLNIKEISSKATETAKLNKYPPRIGPRGYRGLKPQWGKEMESAPDDAIYVEAEPGILGAQKIETYIYPEDILRLLNKKWLDISVITWFQIMLHSMLETRGGNKVNKCAFISPSEIQATICESNGEGVVSYIVDAMRFHKDKLFFVASYWQGVYLGFQKNTDEKPVENYIVMKYVEEAVARLKEDIDTTHPMNWTLVEVKVLHGYPEPVSC